MTMTSTSTLKPHAVKTDPPAVRNNDIVQKIKRAYSVEEAIKRATAYLLNHQHSEGYWWGELESNSSMEAEYVMLLHILGKNRPERLKKIVAHIVSKQLPTGGWPMYYGGDGDLSTSIECYTALKMTGADPNSEFIQRAKRFILSKGGVEKTRVFTKIWLAMLGQWKWEGVPYLPPELVLLPNKLPVNIYSFASWTRATVVPMTIILSEHPEWPLDPNYSIDELYVNGKDKATFSLSPPSGGGWERMLYAADKLLRTAERMIPFNPFRNIAKNAVEKWILEHQEADGSWGGIQPPWVYSLIALKALGYSTDSSVIRRGLDGFESFGVEEKDTWRLQACVSPVWDTCLTLNALRESGTPASHPSAVRASDWLINQQIEKPGDWQIKAPDVEPGGWAFEFENDLYPDTDDAAEIILALARCDSSDQNIKYRSIEKGLTWIIGMQSKNGGWGSFDKDNTSQIVTRLPFFDFGETIDPPSVDVTAHIIEALGILGVQERFTENIKKAIQYIWKEQEEDGPWFGRWGINYIYGTAAVLPALAAIGWDMADPRIKKASDWIETYQNLDGGWGETPASYANPALRGKGESSASQTAWALIALISANRANTNCVRKGINYLLATQTEDGTWNELQYTATGFPGYGIGDRVFKKTKASAKELRPEELPTGFMIKYHMYRIYWPLLALGRYCSSI